MHKPVIRRLVALVGLATGLSLSLTATSDAAAPQAAKAPAQSAAQEARPLGPDAIKVAREYVRSHSGDYGMSAAEVAQLTVSSVVPTESNGLTNVYLQQRVNAIEVSTAMLNVAVTSKGKVLRVASSAVTSATKKANASNPQIRDVVAAEAAAEALGLEQRESFASNDAAHGADQERTLGDGGISRDPVTAKLVYQETPKGTLRLAWELGINQLDDQHWWQIRMDAATGDMLGKTDWVAEDSHRVYPFPTEAPSFGARALVSNPATSASPFGWNDTNGAAGAESTLTVGNNARAYTDLNADNLPDAGSSPDGGAGLAFDFALDLAQPPSSYRPAAVSNLYYANNRIHDILYRYGFNEQAGNFQVNNYGSGGAANDAVNAEAQDGSGTNNANFSTPPDGSSPRMQMFVWTDATPDRDSDLDNGIIIHEYGHGVSNRLTGGPAAAGCLNNQEQGGEGWSDYLAYMLTMRNGSEPAGGRGIGTYALNQPTNGPGIRTQKYSTNMAINDHTYDSIKSMVAPHGVGEVWASMLWDLTYSLIDQYGFSSNLTAGNAGNNKSLQLVMDGMKLQPCSPGFVDARDAILAADRADYAGANQCLIWDVFARRGLGFSALQGSSGSKFDGTEAFDLPSSCDGVELTATAAPSPVPAGQQLTYSLHLANTASAAVSGVSVASALGDHVAYVAGSATCGGTYDAGTDTVTFPIGSMAVGTTRDCLLKVLVDSSPFGNTVFSDDFEPNLSAWVPSHGAGALDWALTTTNSHSPTHAAFASDPSTVSDQYLRLASPVAVAAGDKLSFWHTHNLENSFDGGVVEVSTNGGTTWADIGEAAFTANGYNATISTSFGSPISGRRAFSGSSPYVQSVASLAAYGGQTILIRFRMASDSSVGAVGWTVDDVHIGNEVSTTSHLTTSATGFPTHSQDVTTRIIEPVVATRPGMPTVTGSTPGSGSVTVSFTPGSDGGSPVTSFTAQCVSTDGGATRTTNGSASPITVSPLTTGKNYHCRVRATNAIGTGPYSAYGTTVLVSTSAPAAPTVTSTTPLGGAARVSFSPGSDGGSPVTSFAAQCVSTDGGATRTTNGSASPITVSPLTTGKNYHCRVRATNAIGTGPYSAYGTTVLVSTSAPAAPTVTSTTPLGGAARVSFSPGSNGGSPVTSFTAQCVSTDGGATRTTNGNASPITVSPLTTGKNYHCRVRATNAIGTGPYSAYGTTVAVT